MTSPGNPPNRVSRRGFLIAVTGSAIAAAAGCRPADLVVPTPYAPGSTALPTGTPRAAGAATAAAATSPATADARYGAATYDKLIVTSANDLYVTQYDYNHTPQIDAKTWSLRVDGLVETPITLDYEAVKAFPAFEDLRTLECIGNPVGGNLIGNVKWKGFLFEEILKQVKVKPEAKFVKFEAADGYSTSDALEWLTQSNVMMAYEMNGEPLSVIHGFPIRVLIPGLYGQKMPRWITHIEFIDQYYRGYWESNGWSDVASVQTNSIIDTPSDSYTFAAGTSLYIQGVAFAGKRKITAVEVQIDKGPWMPAQLTQGQSPLAWTQWYLNWTASAPGTYQIGVRATDDTGFVQSQDATNVFSSAPDGTSAIHRITVVAS